MQLPPQAIPPTSLVTVPVPVPALTTVRGKAGVPRFCQLTISAGLSPLRSSPSVTGLFASLGKTAWTLAMAVAAVALSWVKKRSARVSPGWSVRSKRTLTPPVSPQSNTVVSAKVGWLASGMPGPWTTWVTTTSPSGRPASLRTIQRSLVVKFVFGTAGSSVASTVKPRSAPEFDTRSTLNDCTLAVGFWKRTSVRSVALPWAAMCSTVALTPAGSVRTAGPAV
jgi:hypothetical protein